MITGVPFQEELGHAYEIIESYPILYSDEQSLAAISIGAPELIRYHLIADLLETSALELIYVNYGTSHVDFSIGEFQMKPSFIESLELLIQCEPELKEYLFLTKYDSKATSQVRSERLRRIHNKTYQLYYLKAFYKYSSCHFAHHLKQLSKLQQIEFIATYYNMGLTTSLEAITQYQKQENFPYGADYQGDQYAYGRLSSTIYHSLITKKCLDLN